MRKKFLCAAALGLIVSILTVMLSPYLSYAAIVEEEERQAQIEQLMSERDRAYLEEDDEKVERINEQLNLLGVEQLNIEQVRNIVYGESAISPRIIVPESTDYIRWESTTYVCTYGGVTYELQYIYASPTDKPSVLLETGHDDVVFDSSYDWGNAAFEVINLAVSGATNAVGEVLTEYVVTAAEFIADVAAQSGTSASRTIGDSVVYFFAHRTTVQFVFVKELMQTSDQQRLALVATKGYTNVTCAYQKHNMTSSEVITVPYSKYSYAKQYNASLRKIVQTYLEEGECTKSYVTEVVMTIESDTEREYLFEIWPYITDSMVDLLE